MELTYLWDTNAAIYYLQQDFSHFGGKIVDDIAENSQICISVITNNTKDFTEIENLRLLNPLDPQQ